jgi:chitinase
MRTDLLIIALVLCCSAQAQSPALVGYWHNWNDANAPYLELDQIDPRYNVIEIAFAEPAVGTTYDMVFTPSGTAPSVFAAQVAAHQAQGHKVLISIGGANATVHLNSDAERDQFVNSVLSIISDYGFDGIDIDLEGASVSSTGGTIAAPTDAPIIRLIAAVNTIADQFELDNGTPMMLTMAPETAYVQGGMSAFGGIWGAYLPIIDALRDRIDILQVQLYNSGSMYGIDGWIYTQGTADFIVSQTEAVIQGFMTGGGDFQGLAPEHVAVALPACASAAGGGYTDTATVRMAIDYLLGTGPQPGSYTLAQPGGYPGLRGMMTWSINWDAASACNGAYSYAETYERIFGDISTGILSTTELGPLRIAPNPVTDRLCLPARSRSSQLTITDLSGRPLMRNELLPGQTEIMVDRLGAGPYVLVLDDGSTVRQVRFVKY